MPKSPTPKLSSSQMLDAVPTRNARVRVERHGSELLLRVPVKPRWFLGNPLSRALLPQKKHRSIVLDALGGEVWETCDGRTTVEEITEAFAEKHRLRFHEARMSVMRFLQMLTERGCVAMVVPEQSENAKKRERKNAGAMVRDVRRSRPHVALPGAGSGAGTLPGAGALPGVEGAA